jgi:hypothetical protein
MWVQFMFYLIYQITNKTNGKIYIGKHQTENKDDGYMGSGKFIRYAIEKEGIENFEKKILFECESEEELNRKEAELVNEEFVKREDTYNINTGGCGGWNYINDNRLSPGYGFKFINEHHLNNSANQCYIVANKIRNDPEFRKQFSEKISKSLKKCYIERHHSYPQGWNAGENNGMFGKHHSQETRQKLSKSHIGEKNSQYGKMWICNDETRESKSILKSDSIPNGWRKGRILKK